ncbi:hypothetical protein VTI28DRAFT_959 [Corynascus sepedonium]
MAQPMGLTASDIEFAEATPEQRRLSWELCGQNWAAPMSIDDYVEREQHMAEHELTRDGGCRYWVLYLKGYPRQVIASCETVRKLMFIADCPGRSVREAHGYVVTNVYTNPSYRRQGMAAFLLRRVQEQIDTNSDCSVLYSDSGRSYYASLGWLPITSHQATLTLLSSPSSTSSSSPSRTPSTPPWRPQTRPLSPSELPDLCRKDIAHLTKTLTTLTATAPASNNTAISFLPTHAQISWHLSRAEFDARKILPPATLAASPLTIGAVTLPSSSTSSSSSPSPSHPGPAAWAYWSHDWRNKRLRVLRLARDGDCAVEGTDEEEGKGVEKEENDKEGKEQEEEGSEAAVDDAVCAEVAALLEAAVAEARRWGFAEVVVWNPNEVVKAGCKSVGNALPEGLKVVFEQRVEGCVPSLRWRGGKVLAGVVWEENHGFCGC